MTPTVIAFYLPQYHPIKENDEWFGKGFTEWTNVGKAKPLFKGHNQPRVPADLGYYDLRLPQVRAEQAELAKKAGISGFCYYHYWFGDGRTIMDFPLQEVVRLGEPDFPFCLCWANHNWYKKEWNPTTKDLDHKLLFEMHYSGVEDITAQFYHLLPTFKDKRYMRIDGRLLYIILDITALPDVDLFKTTWNSLAKENGLPEFYFLAYTSKLEHLERTDYKGCEATALSLITNIVFKQNFSKKKAYYVAIKNKIASILNRPLEVHTYKEAMNYLLDPVCKQDNVIPVVFPNWDWSPRRGVGGLILKDAKPEYFKEHVKQALEYIKDKPQDKQLLFVKSWNEWGEGNYMEPDLTYGHGYINALKNALDEYSKKHIR